jgi:hypothetical protein
VRSNNSKYSIESIKVAMLLAPIRLCEGRESCNCIVMVLGLY